MGTTWEFRKLNIAGATDHSVPTGIQTQLVCCLMVAPSANTRMRRVRPTGNAKSRRVCRRKPGTQTRIRHSWLFSIGRQKIAAEFIGNRRQIDCQDLSGMTDSAIRETIAGRSSCLTIQIGRDSEGSE